MTLASRHGFRRALDTLIGWYKTPSLLGYEEIKPPERDLLVRAADLVTQLTEPPTSTVPDGDGGIVFERRAGAVFESFTLRSDCSVEWRWFRNGRLEQEVTFEGL